jgi:hypothetical protein
MRSTGGEKPSIKRAEVYSLPRSPSNMDSGDKPDFTSIGVSKLVTVRTITESTRVGKYIISLLICIRLLYWDTSSKEKLIKRSTVKCSITKNVKTVKLSKIDSMYLLKEIIHITAMKILERIMVLTRLTYRGKISGIV